MRARARLLAYSRWQAADFGVERLPGIVLITLAFVGLTVISLPASVREGLAREQPEVLPMALYTFGSLVSSLWFPLAIVAANQISAADRASGRFRLLFAKPVSVRRYYLQAYVVNGVLLLAAAAAMLAPVVAFLHARWPVLAQGVLILGAAYLAIGGTCFLFSAVTRLDWLVTTAVVLVSLVLERQYRGAAWTRALPPFHLIDRQVDALREGRAPGWNELALLAAVGLVTVALGILIIRRRPLAT